MRAYSLTGGGIDGLRLVDVGQPRPRAGQVLLRMRAASLNFRDLLLAGKLNSGVIPLSDGAAEVVEVGEGVDRFRPGDHVMPAFYQSWIYGRMRTHDLDFALGGAIDGVLAEYRVLHADGLVPVPNGLNWQEAATLPCAAVTAWRAVREVKVGETVLILGTGGVSLFALQFAKALGACVIALSSSEAKLSRLRALGADGLINYRAREDWDKAVLDLTDGEGVDHVVEVGGGGTLEKSIAATRHSGSIHLIGILTSGKINPVHIMLKNLKLLGIEVGSREIFEEMCGVIAAHQIKPVIDRALSFEQAPDAYRYLESAQHVGKVVIDFGE